MSTLLVKLTQLWLSLAQLNPSWFFSIFGNLELDTNNLSDSVKGSDFEIIVVLQ